MTTIENSHNQTGSHNPSALQEVAKANLGNRTVTISATGALKCALLVIGVVGMVLSAHFFHQWIPNQTTAGWAAWGTFLGSAAIAFPIAIHAFLEASVSEARAGGRMAAPIDHENFRIDQKQLTTSREHAQNELNQFKNYLKKALVDRHGATNAPDLSEDDALNYLKQTQGGQLLNFSSISECDNIEALSWLIRLARQFIDSGQGVNCNRLPKPLESSSNSPQQVISSREIPHPRIPSPTSSTSNSAHSTPTSVHTIPGHLHNESITLPHTPPENGITQQNLQASAKEKRAKLAQQNLTIIQENTNCYVSEASEIFGIQIPIDAKRLNQSNCKKLIATLMYICSNYSQFELVKDIKNRPADLQQKITQFQKELIKPFSDPAYNWDHLEDAWLALWASAPHMSQWDAS